MVGFAGYEMPVQFSDGVLAEHLHCRSAAGLFDVSHMGQIKLYPRSGEMADAAAALETLVPMDILSLKPGRQRYALLTNEEGGIRDDLMIAHRGDHFLLVVNAACKHADFDYITAAVSDRCRIEFLSERALIALQGPQAGAALARLLPEVDGMRFMDVTTGAFMGTCCFVARAGYTGEDGFEILVPGEHAVALTEALLEQPEVKPIGLGARDSLRLEAGLCLYGNDLDETTSPVEAALEWSVQKARRPGGSREGGFPGADRILAEWRDGASRRRIGLRPEGRAPVRAGATLYPDETSRTAIGSVTSGTFAPTLKAPVSMGYVATDHAVDGRTLFADVRGKRLPVAVGPMPFVAQTYKR